MKKFLLHILPSKFIRIRHCGFLGNRFKKENITMLKEFFGEPKDNKEEIQKKSWEEIMEQGFDSQLMKKIKNQVEKNEFKHEVPRIL